VVVPSVVDGSGDRDGLPNVELEAMASARPVIASDVGAISTAVSDGETGILIRMRDPIALAAALKRLASEPVLRERLGRNARSLVQREYDVGRCTERFYQVLQNAYT
jgi:glycosyltransferase involved in cell wall biosynthesis